jgi:hypothetical protein
VAYPKQLQSADDLLGANDSVTVNNWFPSNSRAQVASINAGNETLLNSQALQMMQAMASFATENSGFNPTTALTMPTDSALQAAMAAKPRGGPRFLVDIGHFSKKMK